MGCAGRTKDVVVYDVGKGLISLLGMSGECDKLWTDATAHERDGVGMVQDVATLWLG